MKTVIKIIIALILLCAGWYASRLFSKAKEFVKPSPIAEVATKRIQTEAAKIKDDVDKNGLEHTILKMTKEIDQSAVDKVKADLLDTVAALNIERDKLKQITVIAATLSIKAQRLEKKITELATTYSHFDDHFRLSVNVPKDSLQSPTFDAGYDADLITTQYNKGNWLTGNSTYLDIYSNDPRFTIKGARTFTVKQNRPFFDMNLQAISEYNFRTNTFAAGPSLNIGLGRVEIRGRYMYDPSDKQWSGIVSGGYMLLRK